MTVHCYYFKYQISNYYLPSATTVFTSLFATNHKNKFTVHRLVTTVHCHTAPCTATLHCALTHCNVYCHTALCTATLHGALPHCTLHCHTAPCTATLHCRTATLHSWCNTQNPIFKLHYLIFYRTLIPPTKKVEGKNPNQGCTRTVAIHQ